MEIGRIGLVSGGKDWAARLITAVTRSEDHHVVIAQDETWCWSAEPTGVKLMRIDHYPRVRWLEPIGTQEQQAQALSFAAAQDGRPYNKAAFVFAGLHALGLVPACAEEPLDRAFSRYGWTCSALVDAAYFSAGVDILPHLPSLFVYPAELARSHATL